MKRNRELVRNDEGVWPFFISILRLPGMDSEDERRRLLSVSFMLLGIPVLSAFALHRLILGETMRGLILLIIAAGFTAVLLLLRFQKDSLNLFRVNLLILGSLLVYLMIPGGLVNTPGRVLFMYIFPFFSYYLLGKGEGSIWNGIIFVISLPLLFIPDRLFGAPPHSAGFTNRFIVTFILVSAMSYFYEAIREKYQRHLEEEQDKLHSEIRARKLTQETLR
ncbi:MAG: hypothetical protein ABII06_21215, partial [Pseudomonadota bacterium]